MAEWTPIKLTGGCVNTREESGLQDGELVSSSRVRIKPNDLGQVHRDKGNSTLLTTTAISDIDYISWEESDNQILVTRTPSNGTMDLHNAVTGASGLYESFTGTPPDTAAVHRGNEYFVGTTEANHVLYDSGGQGAFRDMGMDGVSTFVGEIATSTDTHDTGYGTSLWVAGDVVLYWITEYDSVNDIESGPVQWQINNFLVGYSGTGAQQIGNIPSVKINSGTNKLRFYRAYMGSFDPTGTGSGSEAGRIKTQLQELGPDKFNQLLVGRGGRLAEEDWGVSPFYDGLGSGGSGTANSQDPGKLDPALQWPQIYINTGSVAALFEKLVKTRQFDVGVLWNDSLVVNDPATSDQILRFSPPGQPEYQPDPYFMYFATKSSDEIVGFEQLNGRLIVLLKGSVWRVNYLPYEGYVAAATGKVQESVNDNEGCVSRNSYTVVETESGEVLVWLSPEGLRATNGVGWTDICPDWSTEGAGLSSLSSAVLHDNRSLYRIELYSGLKRYDFYYHPTLLKSGKFRFMGPTTMNVTVLASTSGELSGVSAGWIGSSTTVQRQNTADDQSTMELKTGQIHPPNPMQSIEVNEVALTHNAQSGEDGTVKVTTKEIGESSSSETVTIDLSLDETTPNSFAGGGNAGNWVQFEVTASAYGKHALGPLWAQVEVLEDADG